MDFPVAASPRVVFDNIRSYKVALEENEELQRRASYHQSWYAFRDGDTWLFGPSKFVGYEGIDADEYVSTSIERNGRATEAHLKKWFSVVENGSSLHDELADALTLFLARFGRAPRTKTRINVFRTEEATPRLLKSSADRDLVDLLITVAKTLPAADRLKIKASI
ncbi:MAG: hypothetical protein ABS87_10070 [Sphingomonas sp. SCN 67-18]|nr:hypothetical protein [Sphingomonas sp. SCN 67-18]ODU20396.1 MAG: hypothetical protein ABS87_10070 [Sphingomonas sp. SCN 67-18]